MLKGGYEHCDECGAKLPYCNGRTLDDELLCYRCYAGKSRSLRWILVNTVTNAVLALVCISLVLGVCRLSAVTLLNVVLSAYAVVGVLLARAHILAVVKDILMKRRTYDERHARKTHFRWAPRRVNHSRAGRHPTPPASV